MQTNHYYPFDMAFAEASKEEQGKQPYKYNGKELEDKHGLNLYDYAARHMEPAIGRFTTIDPMAEKYYSISPYVYVANNPLNAIDPDGRLVIFINGMHAGSGGKSEYWHGFDKKVMTHLNDYKALYLDGALGGASNLANNKMAKKRFGGGYYAGLRQASSIVNSISKNGKINETIKIISHSMGGAYAKGYITALLEYFKKVNIDPSIIEFEADFAPYQPNSQKTIDGIDTYQFSHNNDLVAGDKKIEGIENYSSKKYKNTTEAHSIPSFTEQIKALPSGKYKVENGKIIPQ